MTQSKHTPGPWELVIQNDFRATLYKPGRQGIVTEVVNENKLQDDDNANAQLIAAAPELLEALEWAWEFYTDKEQVPDKVIDIIEATINKARGTE